MYLTILLLAYQGQEVGSAFRGEENRNKIYDWLCMCLCFSVCDTYAMEAGLEEEQWRRDRGAHTHTHTHISRSNSCRRDLKHPLVREFSPRCLLHHDYSLKIVTMYICLSGRSRSPAGHQGQLVAAYLLPSYLLIIHICIALRKRGNKSKPTCDSKVCSFKPSTNSSPD